MDIAYKVLVTVLSLIIIIASGFAFILGHSEDVAVNNYFESVSKIIIESDYNENVIDSCISDAADQGYELTVNVYGNGKDGSKKYADIELKYMSNYKLFGISIDKVKKKVI